MERRPSYPVTRLDYELPEELIAQQPLPKRADSRLLYVRVGTQSFEDRRFCELPDLLPLETLIVLNDSRVVPARVFGRREVNELGQGGGRVEVLFHRWLGDGVCEAVVGSGASQPAGEQVLLPGAWRCELLEPKQLDGIRVLYLNESGRPASFGELMKYLDKHGLPPTPPYIKRDAETPEGDPHLAEDRRRYQTVYAAQDGSVAAPTAGLHFDDAMLGRLAADGHDLRYVTLHVGLGTFAPVRVEDLAEHEMHEEAYSVDGLLAADYAERVARREPVLAVGTTSLRVLHTLASGAAVSGQQKDAGRDARATGKVSLSMGGVTRYADPSTSVISGITDAFIYPGRGTDACDLLLTNFHLPRSTLLALVYAFGREELMRQAYKHAIAQRYRFYSYGDCMLIDRRG